MTPADAAHTLYDEAWPDAKADKSGRKS
jgi:hypothetical protein